MSRNRLWHKWTGIVLCLFLLLFSLSGILLNHRGRIANVNVPRGLLPERYEFRGWNSGLLRGSLDLPSHHARIRVGAPHEEPAPPAGSSILLYGAGGVWKAEWEGDSTSAAPIISDFNKGLPRGADERAIRSMVMTPGGDVMAAANFALFRLDENNEWRDTPMGTMGERLTDATMRGDTLVVVGRSYLYISQAPYSTFKRIQLKAPKGMELKETLFKTFWKLHSGEMFGMAGRLVVDFIALILIFLSISGIICWLKPRALHNALTKFNLKYHNKVGRLTIVLTAFVVVTGWTLRPPLMIPLVMTKTAPMVKHDNPWDDRLRMLRYDEKIGDWLLSTSDGFFSLSSLDAKPVFIADGPKVSVMGLNVLEPDAEGRWLCGSFSGMTLWDRQTGKQTDYFTGHPISADKTRIAGATPISGLLSGLPDMAPEPVDYSKGTSLLPQPENLQRLPMSLWNLCLEIHTGRLFFGSAATLFFIFVAGLLAIICLWTGWKCQSGRRKRAKVRGEIEPK